MKLRPRLLGGLFATTIAAALGTAPVHAATVSGGFDVGRGPQGEICRAERVWNDPAAKGLFDAAYTVRCRGWTETSNVGRIRLIADTPAAREAMAAARASRLQCGSAGTIRVDGLGSGEAAKCRNREGGFDAMAATIGRPRQLLAFEGLELFAPNIVAGARALAGGPMPEAMVRPTAGFTIADAGARPAAAGDAQEDPAAVGERRTAVLEYSTRGQFSEAREVAARYADRLPLNASYADRIEFRLETALAASNLGYSDAAAISLQQAQAMLAGADAPTGARAAELQRKLAVYRAVDALNRRAFTDAIRLADTSLQGGASVAATPLQDGATLRQLNAGGSGIGTVDDSWKRPLVLRSQAQFVRGSALRALGRLPQAEAALRDAEASLTQVGDRGLDVLWLRSSVAAERGQVAQRQNRAADARALFGEAATILEGSSRYAGTPLLAQRQVDYANALFAGGDAAAARVAFDRGFDVMRGIGPTASASVTGLDAYFTLLAADAGRGDAQAQARFFEAAQLINPPAVATQIAQLQKAFEAGDGRARTLQDLEREVRALSGRLAALPAEAVRERQATQAELKAAEDRAAQVRSELAGDQQYQQVVDTTATLAELQKALRPDEAYLKLVSLSADTYAILVRANGASIYRVPAGSAALRTLAANVRKSIDGNRARNGNIVVLPFDVESSYQLKTALLGDGAALNGVSRIIAEPTGPLTQLPLGVLVTDRQSVDRFAASVKVNSRDYTGVRFLASQYEIGAAVSPRSFLIGRSLGASAAASPYLGLGNHAVPTVSALTELTSRGVFRQCAARAGEVRTAFANLRPVGATELATAQRAMGAGARVIEGGAFTDTAVAAEGAERGDLNKYAVLHFATHGLKEGELGCDSPPALVTSMGDKADSDGLLSFEEIAALRLDANLVVLSACNTAAGTTQARTDRSGFRSELGQAATLNGLARAFMVAGGRSVLTTHWAIPDSLKTRDGRTLAPSTQLIGTMFEAGASMPVAQALKRAQSSLIATPETSHPYFWGAFMLVGDGTRNMLARSS